MIAHDSWWSNESVFQLSSTITDYHVPFEWGLILNEKRLQNLEKGLWIWRLVFLYSGQLKYD